MTSAGAVHNSFVYKVCLEISRVWVVVGEEGMDTNNHFQPNVTCTVDEVVLRMQLG